MEKKTPTLKELAIDHDYYCNESNYYSNEASMKYDTFPHFYNDWHDADVDMNLVFRWDLKKRDEEEGRKTGQEEYYLELFIIKQRKGIFSPIIINNFTNEDIPNFMKYIKPHAEKLKSIWQPIEM